MFEEQKGVTVWFTGLSGSGKSTLAKMLAETLRKKGLKIEVLDGDEVRKHLSKGLGFSKQDRDENIRRIGYVCHLLSRNGVIAIASAISPYKEIRNENRKLIGNFVEVFCKCPMEVLMERDIKGLYKKALAGEIPNFTGVSDPYEEPDKPEVTCYTDCETKEESLKKILQALEEMGYLSLSGEQDYSKSEQEKIKKKLEDLGYI